MMYKINVYMKNSELLFSMLLNLFHVFLASYTRRNIPYVTPKPNMDFLFLFLFHMVK